MLKLYRAYIEAKLVLEYYEVVETLKEQANLANKY